MLGDVDVSSFVPSAVPSFFLLADKATVGLISFITVVLHLCSSLPPNCKGVHCLHICCWSPCCTPMKSRFLL